MNKKKTLYRTLLILGLGLLAAALALTALLGNRLPDTAGGAMVGVSSGLAAMGLANLLMLRQAEKDPRLAKQTEIEEKDERNTAIRGKASAKTLEILRVALMAAVVWAAAGDSSRQLAVLLFGVLLLLSGVEFGCTLYYRRKM